MLTSEDWHRIIIPGRFMYGLVCTCIVVFISCSFIYVTNSERKASGALKYRNIDRTIEIQVW